VNVKQLVTFVLPLVGGNFAKTFKMRFWSDAIWYLASLELTNKSCRLLASRGSSAGLHSHGKKGVLPLLPKVATSKFRLDKHIVLIKFGSGQYWI